MEYRINYSDVLKSVAQGILVVNLEGCLIDVNDEFADLLGYTKNEMIGKHIVDISPFDISKSLEEDSPPIKKKLKKIGCVQNHQTQYLKKDKTVVFAEVNISSLKDNENKLIGYVTAVRVIMDLKTRERTLRESEDFLRKIIINGPEYILVKDREGKFVVASKSAAEFFGLSLDDLIGKSNFDFVNTGKMSIQDAERIKKSDLDIINSGKKNVLEESVTLKDGSKRWFQTTKVPLARNGVPDYVLGISVEITERKMNFDMLIEKDLELEANNKALNELNVTLKVLIQQKENDRLELEQRVLDTIKLLVEPYVEKLDKICSKPSQKSFLELIKKNLNECMLPYANKLSSNSANFSISEIHVIDFVKNGYGNKEIAGLLNISVYTVAAYRQKIRKKLGISNSKTNLRSFLKSL